MFKTSALWVNLGLECLGAHAKLSHVPDSFPYVCHAPIQRVGTMIPKSTDLESFASGGI